MSNYSLGLDLGQARDYSALVIVERLHVCDTRDVGEFGDAGAWHHDGGYFYEGERLYDTYRVVHIQRWPLGTEYTTIVDDVAEIVSSPQMRNRCRLVIDYTGVGRGIMDLFKVAHRNGRMGGHWPTGVTITGGFASADQQHERGAVHKGDLVSNLQHLAALGRVAVARDLPLADVLERELRAFRVKQNPKTGNVGWEAARESDHDDVVIALALALWRKHSHGEPRYIAEDGSAQEKPWAIATHPF